MSRDARWRELYPFQSYVRKLDDQRFHYLDEGRGPVLLCVHGNPTWSFYWRHIVLAFRDRCRVIVPDHIGCGLSGKPQDYPYTLAQHVKNLKWLIETLAISDITLLAHDWGGAIGLGAAVSMPERFGRLVLFNTAAFRDSHMPLRIRACRAPVVGPLAVRGMNAFAKAALTMATAKPERFTPQVCEGYLAPYDSWANRVAIQRFVEDIPLKASHPSYAMLAHIEHGLAHLKKKPTSLIWGMKDWCFTPHFLQRFADEFFPQAEVHPFHDCGHYVVEDAHERIVPILQEFLEKHGVLPKSTPAEKSARSAAAAQASTTAAEAGQVSSGHALASEIGGAVGPLRGTWIPSPEPEEESARPVAPPAKLSDTEPVEPPSAAPNAPASAPDARAKLTDTGLVEPPPVGKTPSGQHAVDDIEADFASMDPAKVDTHLVSRQELASSGESSAETPAAEATPAATSPSEMPATAEIPAPHAPTEPDAPAEPDARVTPLDATAEVDLKVTPKGADDSPPAEAPSASAPAASPPPASPAQPPGQAAQRDADRLALQDTSMYASSPPKQPPHPFGEPPPDLDLSRSTHAPRAIHSAPSDLGIARDSRSSGPQPLVASMRAALEPIEDEPPANDYPGVVNVALRLKKNAALMPESLAVVAPCADAAGQRIYDRITFSQLDRVSDRLARGLRLMGVTPGARIALMVPPGIQFVALVFALFKSGAVSILIDPGMGRWNVLGCLAQAEPEGFIGIPLVHKLRKLFFWRFPKARYNVVVGGPGKPGKLATFEDVKGGTWSGPEITPTKADDPAAIIFTTGSTGTPKGVLYRHGNFDAQVDELQQFYNIQRGEVSLSGFPLFTLFDAAMGVTAVIPDMDPTRPALVDPENILSAIDEWRITQAFASPAMWNRVSRHCEVAKREMPTLERALSAGAAVPPEVIARVAAAMPRSGAVHTPYGATEALPVASISSRELLAGLADEMRQGKGTCVGRKFPGITWKIIRITDGALGSLDDAEPLPAGEIGELIVKGPVVTREYWRRPDANRLGKIEDEPGPDGQPVIWHRMGDVGYLDQQGRFWFCGRKSHRVITPRGTLFTEPCEAIFNTHPQVYRSALVGVGRAGQQRPVILVELEPTPEPRTAADKSRILDELRTLAKQQPLTAEIERFLIHPAFPVDIRHNSKIFREKLARWARWRA